MSVAHSLVDVGSVSAFPSAPQVNLEFEPDFHQMTNEHATEFITYSFDGINVHGVLYPTDPVAIPQTFNIKAKKIWFRGDGSTSPINVRVTSYNK